MPRARGRQLEYEVEQTFDGYREAGVASLMRMPVPTVPCGNGKHGPIFRLSGRAPADVVGFAHSDGRMIIAELKESVEKNRLPIVSPDRRGDGIQWHQAEALMHLWRCGGHPHIVWSQEGAVGVLAGPKLWNHLSAAEEAVNTKLGGGKAQRGALSLPWEDFDAVEVEQIGSSIGPNWLRLDLSPSP